MFFLVELDHVKSGSPLTPEQGRTFIERTIFPTLARAEELVAEGKIVGGGVIVGRIALRFILQADSLPDADRIVSSLRVWPLAETGVTPLVAFSERRTSVQAILESLMLA